jgi:hypothetical protein
MYVYNVLLEKPEEDLCVDEKRVLKWMFKKTCELIHLAQNRHKCRDLVINGN